MQPERRYNSVEIEFDKRFNHHWLAFINLRWGNMWGNYQGVCNDNGQSDPGISSLFDFTPGKLGLLGDQFQPGFLSTDRRVTGNMFLSYNVGSDSRFMSKAKGLTLGMGLRGLSGVPLSLLGDHPIYLNQGEVPVGCRARRVVRRRRTSLMCISTTRFTSASGTAEAGDGHVQRDQQPVPDGPRAVHAVGSLAVGAVPPLNQEWPSVRVPGSDVRSWIGPVRV